MQCKFIKVNQTKCNAYATKDNEFCFVHNPKNRELHKDVTARGGKSTYRNGFIPLEPIDLTKPINIIYMLTDTINRIRRVDNKGCMDISTANCLAILSSRLMEAQKVIYLEKENKELKKKLDHFNNTSSRPEFTEEELIESLRIH